MSSLDGVRILDSDGHVIEDVQAIMQRMPSELLGGNAVRGVGPFPAPDHLHHAAHRYPEGAFKDPGGVEGWGGFLDDLNIGGTVVYPTRALTYGKIVDPDLAIESAKAYNNWLYDDYLSKDQRVKAVALIPMQDPKAAVAELTRSVVELGFVGAMVPGTGLSGLLGTERYWPIYEEADRLGCVLGIHAGAHYNLGLNSMTPFAGVHALGHPFAIAIAFTDMLFNGVFDRFPNARYGFLEGGLGWFLMAMERCAGGYEAFNPVDPQGRFLRLHHGDSIEQYVMRHIAEGRIYVGIEGDEPMLAQTVEKYGSEAFVFSSDFPHEVNHETIRAELEELVENDHLSDVAKENILASNAERFYGPVWSAAAAT